MLWGKAKEALGAEGADMATVERGAVRERDSDNRDSRYGLVLTDRRGQMKEARVATVRGAEAPGMDFSHTSGDSVVEPKVLGFAVWGSFLKVHSLGKFLVLFPHP